MRLRMVQGEGGSTKERRARLEWHGEVARWQGEHAGDGGGSGRREQAVQQSIQGGESWLGQRRARERGSARGCCGWGEEGAGARQARGGNRPGRGKGKGQAGWVGRPGWLGPAGPGGIGPRRWAWPKKARAEPKGEMELDFGKKAHKSEKGEIQTRI